MSLPVSGQEGLHQPTGGLAVVGAAQLRLQGLHDQTHVLFRGGPALGDGGPDGGFQGWALDHGRQVGLQEFDLGPLLGGSVLLAHLLKLGDAVLPRLHQPFHHRQGIALGQGALGATLPIWPEPVLVEPAFSFAFPVEPVSLELFSLVFT